MSFVPCIERVGEVDSTMTVARERARAGAVSGTCVVATSQRSGRGRQGRGWFSPPGAGLFATIVLRPPPRPDGSALTLGGIVCGVAVCEAVRRLGASGALLKWPNDVLVGERKLCGVLTEAEDVAGPAPLMLVGFGVNLAPASKLTLPADLAARYVGLDEVAPAPVTADAALTALLDALGARWSAWTGMGAAPIIAGFQAVDALRGADVRAEVASGPVTGRADGITANGALRLVTPKGVVEVSAGEVTRVRAGA
jgi:BirA family biotin operon repressor/biotin-[acetyl-CoA-carboxylase] ligase